ncbi:sulfotransferase family protein [Haliea sp. E17]|uniref:sulfotransferase family protein n=1 Tax=Haliea sp. E17 TaxID=3401576 RepID=UPI003AB0C056
MLPNFFVVGAQKCGTTSLHEYLRVHPEIYLPEQKETKYFVNNEIYSKGIDYYEREFFDRWQGEPLVGEIDPEYMYFERGLERIEKHFDISALKFIFLFRNPVDRAFSHYLMTYRRGFEDLSFEEALEAEPERIIRDDWHRMQYSYFDRGLYARQLERFFRIVKPSQMHFILSDKLASRPTEELAHCLKFLGLNPTEKIIVPEEKFHRAAVPRNVHFLHLILNEGWYKKVIRILLPNDKIRLGLREKILHWNERSGADLVVPLELRKRLLADYAEDIALLQNMIGQDLEGWLV